MKSILNWRGWFGTPREKNPLAGKRMRYLIGADKDKIGQRYANFGVVTVLPYDYERPISDNPDQFPIGYCNLYWQPGAPDCAPYIPGNDTSMQYGERVINPYREGWLKNLEWQFKRWKLIGVKYVELDNPDGYDILAVIHAIDVAEEFGFKVIAKNPGLFYPRSVSYVKRCHGIISERGAGTGLTLDQIRREAGFPEMPVWFVAWGAEGEAWCDRLKLQASRYTNMSATLSRGEDEYSNAEDVVVPRAA